jgi:SH3 domain protein
MMYRNILLILFFGSTVAQAETAYVTDMLQLNMYATAQMTGAPLKRLRSGDKLDIQERNGSSARVKVGDQQGWVKSLYLQEQEPARTRVNQLEDSKEKLESSVKQLRVELEQKQARAVELEAMQSGELEQQAAIEAELSGLREENQRLENTLDGYIGSVPVSWLLIAVLVSLFSGLAGGWYYIDKRSRDKHGGYRVY